jgi:hypothetical protein
MGRKNFLSQDRTNHTLDAGDPGSDLVGWATPRASRLHPSYYSFYYTLAMPNSGGALPVTGLLDDAKLSGMAAIRRELAPRNSALLIDGRDMSDAQAAIGSACQSWGGGAFPLLPIERVSTDLSNLVPPWDGFISRLDPDWLDRRGLPAPSFPAGIASLESEAGVAQPLLPVVFAQEHAPQDWTPVELWDLSPDDPWFVSYLGCLGWLPETPSAELLKAARYREDLRFEDVIKTRRDAVSAPSTADLMDRLQLSNHMNPVQLSLIMLDRFPVQTSVPISQVPSLFPEAGEDAQFYGHSLVVVYRPGSVQDMCLLWNLRAAFGQPPDLPVALPAIDGLTDLIGELQQGIPGQVLPRRRLALTSLSISSDALSEMTGNEFVVIPADELLRKWKRPARLSTDVAMFESGRAQVAAWAQADRQRVGGHRAPNFGGGLVAHLEVQPQPLPQLLKRTWPFNAPFSPGFRHGGWEEPADSETELLSMAWPSGWKLLQWTLEKQGLTARPSRPGRAAVALLRRLGSVGAMNALLLPDLISRLERLSERKGISWFRQRYRDLRTDVLAGTGNDDIIERLESGLRSLNIQAGEDDANEVTESELAGHLPERALRRRWLEWAEDGGLLIRGVQLRCESCGDRYWRPLADALPPVTCRGCGESIARPFPAGHLEFRYRASEALAQAVSFDAISHLLTMRWFHDYFRAHSGDASELYGMYPGVELLRDGEGVFEVDLLLLMADGALVPGECKRNAGGLSEKSLEKLDVCRQAVGGPWSFVATADPASSCGAPWQAAQRRLPFALTAEHLFDQSVVRAMGVDPFTWRQVGDEEWLRRSTAFKGRLPDVLDWLQFGTDIQDRLEPS